MKYSNEELKKLWANHEKRQAFTKLYKDWDIHATIPDLNLTFYKYDLPDGSTLFVLDHMQRNHSRYGNKRKWLFRTKMYLQKEEYFEPRATSESEVCNHLKALKMKLQGGIPLTYTAEYEITDEQSDDEPITCTVRNYGSIELLKGEAQEIVQDTCYVHKTLSGVNIFVKMTITDSNGEYVDSDEWETVFQDEIKAE